MNRRPGLVATLGVLGAMAALSLWAAPSMPDRVPLHWNLSGEVDRYGGPLEALLLLPAITLGTSLLLWLLPALDPRKEHLRRSARAYNAVWIAALLFLLVLHATTVLGASTTLDLPVLSIVPAAVGALFVVIGNYLPKTSSNWFLGIRTPWTLTSERAWQRTHRLGGFLFVLLGAVLIGASLLDDPATPLIAGAGAMVIAVVSIVYSYLVWRRERSEGAEGPQPSST